MGWYAPSLYPDGGVTPSGGKDVGGGVGVDRETVWGGTPRSSWGRYQGGVVEESRHEVGVVDGALRRRVVVV